MILIATVLSVVSIVGTCCFFWSFRRRQRYRSERLTNQMSGLLAEFKTISSENVARIEDRLRELRRVVREAEECSARLVELVDRADGVERELSTPTAASEDPPPRDKPCREVERLSRSGQSVEEIAQRSGLSPRQVRLFLRVSGQREPVG